MSGLIKNLECQYRCGVYVDADTVPAVRGVLSITNKFPSKSYVFLFTRVGTELVAHSVPYFALAGSPNRLYQASSYFEQNPPIDLTNVTLYGY